MTKTHCFILFWQLVTRAVQIHPIIRPTRRSDQIQLETGRPDYFGGSSPPELDSGGSGFCFPPLKPELTERFPNSSQNFKIPAKISRFRPKFSRIRWKNPDSGVISLRSSEIFARSGEISSNPVIFLLDLAKSHRIQWDFCRSMFFSSFSHRLEYNRPARRPLMV